MFLKFTLQKSSIDLLYNSGSWLYPVISSCMSFPINST